jgi:hypothetical protein
MKWSKIVWVMMFAATIPSWSATKFVNKSATGSNNGTSWANAWTNVSSIGWSGLSAGDVVCVAGGTYSGSISTGKSGTSGNPITIRRATAADATCGSSTTGWTSAFDTQAVIGGINLGNDFVTIDGAVANGFKMNLANVSGSPSAIGVSGPTNGVIVRYTEVAGPCGTTACPQNGDARSIDLNSWNGSSYNLQNNMTIQYNNLHGACTILWSAHSINLIIEHNRFADSADSTPGNPNCHPNVIAEQDSTNVSFRYNEVTNWEVEGIMACPNGGCSSSWDIYGNFWHDPMPGSYPRVLEAQGNSNGPYHVYNNTFVNLYYICANTGNGGSFAPGTQGRNNVFWGNNFANCGLPSDDYDYSDKSLSGEANGQGSASNIFASVSSKDFHLTTHTKPGLNLGSPYNLDYDGNPRMTWDRGAWEFSSGTSSKPNPPTNLTGIPH